MKDALKGILPCLAGWLMATHVQAAISTYTFAGGESEVPTATDLTFGAFERQNLTSATQSGSFRSAGWSTGQSADLTEYVQFTVSVNAGNQLTLSSLGFTVFSTKPNGNNDGGPDDLGVSVFAGILAAGSGNNNSSLVSQSWSGLQGQTQTLNWNLADQTTTTGFTIRFYGWNAENASGRLSFVNVAIDTTVTPVPEPVTAASAAFTAIFAGAMIVRRKISIKENAKNTAF